jgi:hypothetical protein
MRATSGRARVAGVLAVLFSLTAAGARAAKHTSQFGFSIDLPSGWTVLSAKEIKSNPELFTAGFRQLGSVDPGFLRLLRERIEGGKLEMYFHQGDGAGTIANINATQGTGAVPATKADLDAYCDRYTKILGNMMHKTITFRACQQRQLPAGVATYVESAGIREGTRTVQYQIPKSSGAFLTLTGTFSDKVFPKMNDTFDRVVYSLTLK